MNHLQIWLDLASTLIYGWVGRNEMDVDVLPKNSIIHTPRHTKKQCYFVVYNIRINHYCKLCGSIKMCVDKGCYKQFHTPQAC